MKIELIEADGKKVMLLSERTAVITNEDAAMDAMIAAEFSGGTNLLAIPEEALSESFFKLKTGFAEKTLETLARYGLKCAVFGSFSRYANSKPLQTFMREKNKGNTVHFAKNLDAAVEWLVKE